MKKIATLFLLLSFLGINAQIKGKVTDAKNEALAVVSVYLDGTITGTTTNEDGYYELPLHKTGKHTVVFQFLGYKTLKKNITITSFPFTLNAKLEEERVTLDEVNINSNDNPANRIIRNVIANKKKNQDKVLQFTADFYSRGLYKIKNAPKKILGRSLGDLGGGLDSTRSGIVYLSETFSKISHQKPNKFKEHIVASKVSGSDNGVSFNRAEDVNFNLYKNTVEIGNEIISPIANYAFGYYNYKLVGSFYEGNHLINKIEIQPKRKNDRVFSGHIYIVEDDWALYGTDIAVTGAQVNLPMIDKLHFKQSFNKSTKTNAWIVISQTIDFKIGMFGISINGRFSSAYTNYNFTPNFTDTTFGKEVLSFEKNATKKDTTYWNKLRPIPLTTEEVKDYVIKDSIKVVRKSKKYLDSIDAINNKLSWSFPLTGYNYRNSYEKWSLNIDSPIENLNFNTVQGWNSTLGLNYFKRLNEQGKWINFGANVNYGFSEKKWRPTAFFSYKWNNISRPILRVSGGVTTSQFNANSPISKLDNTIASVFRERNYMKIYDKTFARVSFSREVTNGIRLNSSFEFANRKPLFNTTDYVMFPQKNVEYTSNNPLDPTNFTSSFTAHSMWKFNIGARIRFGSKYLSYPNSKFTISNPKYPNLYIGYRKTFGGSNNKIGSDLFYTTLNQNISLSNWGQFKYLVNGGMFAKVNQDIPFIDYTHFNGNRYILTSSLNTIGNFNSLDYYSMSTNSNFAQVHTEHNFKGFILNKIPLLNKLNFHTVIGAKGLFTNKKPYTELSFGLDNIGWGKWRFLRVDFVQSNFNGQKENRVLFGLSLFD
jgi:hypothetical protein